MPDCRISMDTKPEDTTVHIKLEGIISDKNYHKCVFKNLQGTCILHFDLRLTDIHSAKHNYNNYYCPLSSPVTACFE